MARWGLGGGQVQQVGDEDGLQQAEHHQGQTGQSRHLEGSWACLRARGTSQDFVPLFQSHPGKHSLFCPIYFCSLSQFSQSLPSFSS